MCEEYFVQYKVSVHIIYDQNFFTAYLIMQYVKVEHELRKNNMPHIHAYKEWVVLVYIHIDVRMWGSGIL